MAVKKIEIDHSPEGAAFYAKNSLQEDHDFIEAVMNNDLNPYAEEDKMIRMLDGDDVREDELASIREEMQVKLLHELLETLTEKERKVVTMRAMGCTYEDIGKAVGHVQSWTHTIHKRAIRKLQKNAKEVLNG